MAFKKFTASSQTLAPDPVYGSKLVSKVINCFMTGGRKFASQGVVYGAMDIIADKIKDVPPLEVFEKAVDNVKPMIEVRSKRVGGANYQVPMQVNSRRQLSLAIRWIRDAVRAGKGQPAHVRLANELLAAYKGEGAAMSTRENVHRMAEANKAFAHFAW
ncbi:MAG: 30S ribosomal protein S7 [Planctomycetes bacterium]|jgi:small subunit ribosomal protein S7|nr:30S ribosomal protein S7 [Planctomycetota bacterium]